MRAFAGARHVLCEARLPLGVWIAGIAAVLSLAGWAWLGTWYAGNVVLGAAAALLVAPLALVPVAPLLPLWAYVAGRGFRVTAALAGAFQLGLGLLFVWFGGLVFAPSGLLLLLAALLGARDRSARRG